MNEPGIGRKRGRATGDGTLSFDDDRQQWVGKVRLGRDAKGKLIRRTVRGNSEKEVAAAMRKLRADVDAGVTAVDGRTTVGKLLDDWLELNKPPTLRPRTWQGYESIMRIHLKPAFGSVRLIKLDPRKLQIFYNDLRRAGKSSTTVHHIHACLRTALEQAVSWGEISRNPADLVKAPPLKPKKFSALDYDEVEPVIKALAGHRLESLFVVSVLTGMRQNELFGLQWADIDMERATLQVRHTVHYQFQVGDKLPAHPVFEEAVKNETSERSLHLTPLVVEALRVQRKRQVEERLAASSWGNFDLVFTRRNGMPLRSWDVVKPLRRALVKAGLQPMRFYDFCRHTLATLMVDDGAPLPTAQEIMGHSTPSILLRVYAHARPGRQKQVLDRIERRMFGAENEDTNAKKSSRRK